MVRQILGRFFLLVVVAGGLVPGLAVAGTIRGTAIDARTGRPPVDSFLRIELLAGDGFSQSAGVDDEGRYVLSGLPAGTYRLLAEGAYYREECWDDLPAFNCEELGTPIELSADGEFVADFELLPLGRIAGSVRRADGSPVAGALVSAFSFVPFHSDQQITDQEGRYQTGILRADAYRLKVDAIDGLYGVTYPHVVCDGELCADGEHVEVEDGEIRFGIDFVLRQGGAIVARAENADGTPFPAPLPVSVAAFARPSGRLVARSGSFSTSDDIEIPLLPPGSYTLRASASGSGFEEVMYPARRCPRDQCDVRFGSAVEVIAGASTGPLVFRLPRRTEISGIVRDAGSGELLGDDTVRVEVVDALTGDRESLYADSGGAWIGAVGVEGAELYVKVSGKAT